MCVNNLPKVATRRNSGATRDSNRGRRVLIPSALATRPPSHSYTVSFVAVALVDVVGVSCIVCQIVRRLRRSLLVLQVRCLMTEMKCHPRHRSPFPSAGHAEEQSVQRFTLRRMLHRMSKRYVCFFTSK